jgi:hypothetical protein
MLGLQPGMICFDALLLFLFQPLTIHHLAEPYSLSSWKS